MKKKVFWKILTMALVLGTALAFYGCDNNSESRGDGLNLPPAGGANVPGDGTSLTLSGPVFQFNWETGREVRVTEARSFNWGFLGDWDNEHGSTGTLTNEGNMNFTIQSPPEGALGDILHFGIDDGFDFDISVSAAGAKFATLFFYTEESGPNWERVDSLTQSNFAFNEDTGYMGMDVIEYIYVAYNSPVTVSSLGFYEYDTEDSFRYSLRMQPFNITLRPGWNAVHVRVIERETHNSSSATASAHLGIPSGTRWILGLFGGGSDEHVPLPPGNGD